MKKILSLLLVLLFTFLCACSAQTKESNQLATKIDGLIEDTEIKWNSEDKVVVSFDEHTVNNIVVNLKKPMSAPIKIFDGDNLIYQQNNNSTYKYCAFAPVKTSSLSIEIESGKSNVKSISVYENDNEPYDDFNDASSACKR